MAPIKPLAALLCAAALLVACAPGSRAALTCSDYEVQLEAGNQLGGCNTATIARVSACSAAAAARALRRARAVAPFGRLPGDPFTPVGADRNPAPRSSACMRARAKGNFRVLK